MDIRIISSPSQEINNRHIFSLIKERDKSKNHIIIAPDRSLFSLEKRLFDSTGEKCFFDVNVMSLSRLSRTVLVGNTKNILSKQSGVALVKKILDENKDKLQSFSRATTYLGFASSLYETICFYKSCNVSPQEIFVDDSRTFANLKQKDIKLVYEEYEKYLTNEYTDSFNQLKLFADSITRDTFKNTIFYFVEFDDFTRLMYEIIAKIAKMCDGCYVCATLGKGNNNANIYSNKVYYDLIDLFKFEGLEYKIDRVGGFEEEHLQVLSQNLLAYNPVAQSLKNANIGIWSFDGIEQEVKFVVADIYSHALTTRQDFSNYTIVLPSLNEYKSYLLDELNRYEIPYYLDESKLLIDNCFVRLLFDISKIISSKDYLLSDFEVIIKSPILNFDENAVCDYDRTLHRIDAKSDMCFLSGQMISDDNIKMFVDFVKDIRQEVSQATNFEDCVAIEKRLFEYINARAVEYIDALDSIESRVYSQVVNKFEHINQDISSVFGKVKCGFEEFLEIYKSYFASTNISLPPIASNTIFVADFGVSYVTRVKNLYILGNNEGKLPQMQLDNGLLTDDEIKAMPNANKLSPTIAMLNARKTFKLFELIFKYSDSLRLSFCMSSKEGKLYPNNLINSISTIGGLNTINQSSVLDTISRSFNSLDVGNVIFNNLTPKIAENNLISYLSDWEVFHKNINYRNIVSTLFDIADDRMRKIVDNMLGNHSVQKLKDVNFFGRGYSSISQIETFNMCPYLHFGRYGLRLKENEESRLKPNDIGTIIHEVLSIIVPSIVKGEDCDSIQIKAKNTLTDILKKEEYKSIVENSANNFVVKALYRELERIVVAVDREIKHSGFKPKYYEYRFDNLTIDNIKIKGFIDRVDICDDGFLIIDYKTGDNNFKNFNDVVSGKKLQLLVYAKAFEEYSKKKAKGAFYFPLSNAFGDETMYRLNGIMLNDESNIVSIDSGLAVENYKSEVVALKTTSTGKIFENSYFKNLCLSREDFDYVLDFAMGQVRKAIVNISSGEISPSPLVDGNKSACDYCGYRALCNYCGKNDRQVAEVENINKLKEIGETDGGI